MEMRLNRFERQGFHLLTKNEPLHTIAEQLQNVDEYKRNEQM